MGMNSGDYCKRVNCPWYDEDRCTSPNDHTKKPNGEIECDYDRGTLPYDSGAMTGGEVGMDMHDDNCLELIERYKKQLVESTNIKSSPDEMAVIDSILFRFWQMGWLKEQETVHVKKQEPVDPVLDYWRANFGSHYKCGNCGSSLGYIYESRFCKKCGREVNWGD